VGKEKFNHTSKRHIESRESRAVIEPSGHQRFVNGDGRGMSEECVAEAGDRRTGEQSHQVMV